MKMIETFVDCLVESPGPTSIQEKPGGFQPRPAFDTICHKGQPEDSVRTIGTGLGCGWAMLQILAGVNPAPVAASHGPDIEPCRWGGDIAFDA